MAIHTFCELTLAGHCYEGVLTGDGPGLMADDRHRMQPTRSPGYVALGVAAIRQLADRMTWQEIEGGSAVAHEVGAPFWWVVKYDHERCIDIDGLSSTERQLLSTHFGVPFWPGPFGSGVDPFYSSPAFAALK